MKIDDIHIDGFGQFNDLSISDLSPGLTIFTGPNEAGKTTILTFIRRMLFGFPGGRSQKNHYPPLTGGKHGGRLVIETEEGIRSVIDRTPKNVEIALPDGNIGGREEISRLLGDADRDFFENVCAFGLEELQNLDSLKSDAVQGMIYSAGTGMKSVSLKDIKKDLADLEGALYKKRGTNPQINVIFNKIKENERKLRDVGHDLATYDDLHTELDSRLSEIGMLEATRSEVRGFLNQRKNLFSARDDWLSLREADARLSELPEIPLFPEDGVMRLTHILQNRDDVQSQIEGVTSELDNLEVDIGLCNPDDTLLLHKNEITAAGNDIGKYRSEIVRLKELTLRLESEEALFSSALGELGVGWDAARLVSFDLSIPSADWIFRQKLAQDSAGNEVQKRSAELEQAERELETVRQKSGKVKEEIGSLSPELNEEKISSGLSAVRKIRGKFPDLKEKELALREIEKEEVLFASLNPVTGGGDVMPVWPAVLMPVAGVVAFAGGWYSGDLLIGGSVLVLLLVGAVAYLVAFRRQSGEVSEGVSDAKGDFKDFAALKERARSELAAVRDEMLSLAGILGLSVIPAPEELEEIGFSLDRMADELKTSVEKRRFLSSLMDEYSGLEIRRKSVADGLEAAELQMGKLKREWSAWLSENDLDLALTPESGEKFFQTVKSCREREGIIRRLRSEMDEIRSFTETFEKQVNSLLQACRRSSGGLTPDSALELLRHDLNVVSDEINRLKQLKSDKIKRVASLGILRKKEEDIESKLTALLAAGSARTEDEFRKNAGLEKERIALEEQAAVAKMQIVRLFGDGEKYRSAVAELESGDPQTLHDEITENEKRVKEISEEISDLQQKVGRIKGDITNLESENAGAELRMERSALAGSLHEKSREWASVVMARQILDMATDFYEKERQPAVIKEAEGFFSEITGGRYRHIFSQVDTRDIFVEDSDRHRKGISELSRGTVEQLYLALRFGFIREFGKHSERLPLVFDDILVNFDPKRALKTCEAIRTVSSENQILYFTCHPLTAEMLKEMVPDAGVIDLGVI
ncbi:MAG: AAA family ATPase [Euryarchaeota archaeon]|nr:AAA family ATPase [Euryarchaeota archaeon]